MDSTAVTLVTADSICTAVTRAVDSTMGRAPSASSLIVVQFGNRYAAYNPDIVWKGPSMMYVLDSAFKHLKSITAF
jgi:hypothetical protein